MLLCCAGNSSEEPKVFLSLTGAGILLGSARCSGFGLHDNILTKARL